MSRDPRVDDYIKKAAPFAQPILTRIRQVVHAACPDAVETLKWSHPHFEYKGEMMVGMAAFKNYCVLGFWKSALLAEQGLVPKGDHPMGFENRLESVKDLPGDKTLTKLVKAAMALNDQGIKVARPKTPPKPPVKPPAYFMDALRKNKKAQLTWDAFSPSAKREYVEWLTEAKTDATRDKRLAQAVIWMAEGKHRNWKYMRS